MLWTYDAKNWLISKEPHAGKDLRWEEKATTEDEMIGWHRRLDGHVWVNSGSWWWTWKPGLWQSMGSLRVRYNWVTELNEASWPAQVILGVKNPTTNAGDVRHVGSIPESGKSSGGGSGNLLQYSCLENPMDRGAWWATVHRVTKNRTRLSNWTTITTSSHIILVNEENV